MSKGQQDIEGQMSLFDFIPEPDPQPKWHLPCDTCGYDVKGCCDYDYHSGSYCVLGDKWKPKEQKEPADDYIREHPTCFYVDGHYLDRADGWHKVPEELPNFTTWHLIDVVLFGKKTCTPWMEHDKWEAKDWAFRSVDDRRNTESVTVLAWKLSEESENEEKEI